jgi:hypothetical protein
MLIRIYSFSSASSSSSVEIRIVLFVALAVVFSIGQYLVLEFVKIKSADVRSKKKLHFNTVHKIVTIIQFGLSAILASIILQMVLKSSYSVVWMGAATWISYIMAMVTMGLLAYRFFSWFRTNRDYVVLLYALASIMLAINAAFTLGFVTDLFQRLPSEILEHQGFGYAPFISPGSITDFLNNGYVISSIISFILWWGATVLLLRHYSRRLGKIKYWIILGIPLVYFLMQFMPLFPSLFSLFPNSADIFFIYTVIFTLSKPAGGVLFGVAFWIVVRSFSPDNIVRDYMIISAFGLILLFVSNQAVVLVTVPYPPFGLATISFLGLSSYLILVGVYASAISVSGDTELRKSIRKYAITESKLLDSIGSAQMEQQIQRRVIDMMKQNQDTLSNETGVEPSLSEVEVKQYLHEVIEEVRKGKMQNGNK